MALGAIDAAVASLGALAGGGIVGAILKYLAENYIKTHEEWIKKREAHEVKIVADLLALEEKLTSRCDDLAKRSDASHETQIGALSAALATVRSEAIVARDELRKHFDTELLRVSDRNHKLSNDMGVLMNEVSNQGKAMVSLGEHVKQLADAVSRNTNEVTRLIGRLEGAQLLTRSTDRPT